MVGEGLGKESVPAPPLVGGMLGASAGVATGGAGASELPSSKGRWAGDVGAVGTDRPPPIPLEKAAPADHDHGYMVPDMVPALPRSPRVAGAVRWLDRLLRHLVGADSNLLRYFLWVVLALLPLAAVLGIVLSIQTGRHVAVAGGAVKIVLSDPEAQVVVKVDGDVIDPAGLKEPLHLKAGEHGLLVTSANYKSVRKAFTVHRGGEEVLQVALEPKPRPATFAVVVDPPQAEVAVAGKGASIEGSNAARTITVAEPDGREKVTVIARLAGHKTLVEELQPKPGESRSLALRLIEKRPAEADEETLPELGGRSKRIRPPSAIAPFDEKTAQQYQSGWAAYLDVPVVQTNSIGMKLVLIPPGEFQMGSPKELIAEELKANGDDQWYKPHLPDEGPQHRVRITRPFWLGVTDVTQGEYQRVMGANPSEFSATGQHKDQVRGQDTKGFPVEHVSWDDLVNFCRKLSNLPEEKAAGHTYRLPSEAQWEYACRAGNAGRWCFSAQPDPSPVAVEEKLLGEYAWCGGNADHMTHASGQKRANAWGLHDMYGNVWQWCQDWYDGGYYAHSPIDDPMGPATGSDRVNRGGSWIHPAAQCRSAIRDHVGPGVRDGDLGFRVSLVAADGVAENVVREPAAPHDKVVKVVKIVKVVKVVSAMPPLGVAKKDVREPAAPWKIQALSPQIVQAGKPLSVALVVEDAERWKGQLRYSLAPDAPPGARIDPQTGEFSWTPASGQPAGQHRIGVCATGPKGQTFQSSFIVTVTPRSPVSRTLWGKQISLDLGNGVKLEMLLIPAGEFLMGSPDAEKDASSGEKPQHRVQITKPFYLGKYPVTQAQWQAVVGGNPSHFKGPQNPVEQVSWQDCQAFLGKLNAKVGRPHPSPFAEGEGQFRLAHRGPVGVFLPRGEYDAILLRGRGGGAGRICVV